jgi:hypothetical protein
MRIRPLPAGQDLNSVPGFDTVQGEIRMNQKSLQLPNGAFLPVGVTVEAKKMAEGPDRSLAEATGSKPRQSATAREVIP